MARSTLAVSVLALAALPALTQSAEQPSAPESEGPSDPFRLDAWTIDSAQLLLVPYGRDVRDVESAAFSAPRAGRDPFGLHIAGASSPETTRFIEGLRVDGPVFGLAGTSLPVDFADHLDVQSAGARADQPFGTGGATSVLPQDRHRRIPRIGLRAFLPLRGAASRSGGDVGAHGKDRSRYRFRHR